MTIANPVHDFGEIKRGEKATHVYKFTNTGDEDLTLELVSGCHCSEIIWPEFKVFKPGQSGEIKVTFDSNKEEKNGKLEKVVDIILPVIDPKTGYQIILELFYNVIIVE